jgi:hypothetical protein
MLVDFYWSQELFVYCLGWIEVSFSEKMPELLLLEI